MADSKMVKHMIDTSVEILQRSIMFRHKSMDQLPLTISISTMIKTTII